MPRYPSINGLRAISIALVVIDHLAMRCGVFNGISGIPWLRPFLDFLQDGQLGVNVFFVISGFLITSLLLDEEMRTKSISLKKFYIRRTLRIFPAYFFLLSVYFVLQVFKLIWIPREAWLTAITYTKYFNWPLDWYTGHAWSLSIEEHFYLLWPLIFLAGPKIRKGAAVFLILIVPVVRTYLYFSPDNWFYDLTIFTRIDAIATGCFLALYKKEIKAKISPYFSQIFYASLISLFLLRYLPEVTDKLQISFILIPFGLTHGTFSNILVGLIMMYVVFGPQGFFYKILNLRLVNYIGLLSYSIYLWQQIFLNRPNYWVNLFPQNLVCILLCSLFSYYVVEKPFLKLKRRFER